MDETLMIDCIFNRRKVLNAITGMDAYSSDRMGEVLIRRLHLVALSAGS